MSNPNAPATPARPAHWLLGLCILAMAGWGYFRFSHATAIAAGSDSSGYLNNARLLARGQLMTGQRIPPELAANASPVHFMPLGFWLGPVAGTIAPTYPNGLPLHFAAAGLALGWRLGPLWIIVGSALAAIWLCYLCAREIGVGAPLAAAGAATLGLSPLFIFSSVQALSDTLATAWCLGAVWLALRARRGHWTWALACGTALGVAVMVRPSNVLLLPCLVVLLGRWRLLLAAAAGGLPAAAWIASCNQLLYGSPLRTGYGDIGGTLHAFWVFPTGLHLGLWLSRLLPAGLLLLPFAALPLWRKEGRVLLALGVWWAAFIVFYSFYEVTHESWWCLRFVLPGIPALVLAAVLGLENLCQRAGDAARRSLWAAGALTLWAAAVYQYWVPKLGLLEFNQQEISYSTASKWARANLPPEALVATLPASGSLYYYTGFAVLRWDLLDAPDFRRYAAALRQSGRPVYAMLFPGEETPALHEHMPDQWEKIGTVSGIDFWKLSATP